MRCPMFFYVGHLPPDGRSRAIRLGPGRRSAFVPRTLRRPRVDPGRASATLAARRCCFTAGGTGGLLLDSEHVAKSEKDQEEHAGTKNALHGNERRDDVLHF